MCVHSIFTLFIWWNIIFLWLYCTFSSLSSYRDHFGTPSTLFWSCRTYWGLTPVTHSPSPWSQSQPNSASIQIWVHLSRGQTCTCLNEVPSAFATRYTASSAAACRHLGWRSMGFLTCSVRNTYGFAATSDVLMICSTFILIIHSAVVPALKCASTILEAISRFFALDPILTAEWNTFILVLFLFILFKTSFTPSYPLAKSNSAWFWSSFLRTCNRFFQPIMLELFLSFPAGWAADSRLILHLWTKAVSPVLHFHSRVCDSDLIIATLLKLNSFRWKRFWPVFLFPFYWHRYFDRSYFLPPSFQ